MDIAALSTNQAAGAIKDQVGVAVLSKSLDTIEVLGEGLIHMMEQSVNPHLGQNVDISL